jgi:hypothetical protein
MAMVIVGLAVGGVLQLLAAGSQSNLIAAEKSGPIENPADYCPRAEWVGGNRFWINCDIPERAQQRGRLQVNDRGVQMRRFYGTARRER